MHCLALNLLSTAVLETICFLFSLLLFQNNRKLGTKKNCTDHQKAKTVQLFVAMKEHFSGLFRKGIPQRLNLIDEATYLFSLHKIDIK